MTEKIEKLIPWMIILAIWLIFAFGGTALKEAIADSGVNTSTVTVTAGVSPPSVGTVILNSGLDITLTENATKTVSVTTTVTDTASDITSVEGKIYRSGVGTSCSANDNNCYSDAACATSSPSGNSYTATCEYDVWFHADPTDTGTYSAEYWEAWIKAVDSQNASSSATSTGVEMDTLRALDLSTGTIDYGGLEKGTDTGTLTQVQTTTATGNEAIDIYLYGTRMERSPWESLDHIIATSGSAFDSDVSGQNHDITQIDSTHYLIAYLGPDSDGYSVVLEVDTSDWSVSHASSTFEFDTDYTHHPAISQIDTANYLVTYRGSDIDGWSIVLNINTSTWAISTSSSNLEFDISQGSFSAISPVDINHHLVAYAGPDTDGWAQVLEVNTSTWAISTTSNGFEFDSSQAYNPEISQIDSSHFLVTYTGGSWDGWSVVLEVNTSTWAISTSSNPFEFDASESRVISVFQVDTTHYLTTYRGPDNDGWAAILVVNTSTWAISTTSATLEFDPDFGEDSDISQIDSDHYLVVYWGPDNDGWSVVLEVNASTWAISTSSSGFEFDPSLGLYPVVSKIDSTHYLASYTGTGYQTWAMVLNPYLRNVIPVEYQGYATSGVNYASGTDLTTLATTTLELDMSKPTSHPSTSTDEIYWGLGAPSYIRKGSYYGTNTCESKAD